MNDSIKQRIKSERTSSDIQQKVNDCMKEKKDFHPTTENALRRLSNVGNPIQFYGERPGLAQLEVAVNDINSGQRDLERIRRMDVSATYRGIVQVSDWVLGIFGKDPARTDIYSLFTDQQQNVRNLNYILATMTASYEGDVTSSRKTLDGLVKTTTKESLKKQELDKQIPPEVEKYDNALAELGARDRHKEPEGYYSALQDVIESKRTSRKKRFDYVVTAMGHEHHTEQIDNLMMQEELFETMLYRLMEMTFKTELYQQVLDNNLRAWCAIPILSKAVSRVSRGINTLAEFNHDLNNSYIGAVRDITQIVDAHPGRSLIASTNSDLRQLVSDVNSSSYASQIKDIE